MSTHFRRFARRVWEDARPCLGVLVFVLVLAVLAFGVPLAVYQLIAWCLDLDSTAQQVLAAVVSLAATGVVLRIGLYLLQIWDDTKEDEP